MTDYQGNPSRVLLLLELLRGGGCNLADIQAALDVSPRTAQSYLRSMVEDWGCEYRFDRRNKAYLLLNSGVFS